MKTAEESFDGGLPAGVNPFAMIVDELIVDEKRSEIFYNKWPRYFRLGTMTTKNGKPASIARATSNPDTPGLTQTQAVHLVLTIFNTNGVWASDFAVLKPYAHILVSLWQFVKVVDPKAVKDGICYAEDCHYLHNSPEIPGDCEVEDCCLRKLSRQDDRAATTVYLNPKLLEKLESLARRERKTVSQILEDIAGRSLCDCPKCQPT